MHSSLNYILCVYFDFKIYLILVIEPTSITYNNENDDQAESIKSSLSLKPSTRYHGVQSTS